jgi:putative MATE family efflux protein
MKAGIAAVMVNFIFNWLLIFGKLGLPRLGVRGAAIATVLSRIVELSIIATWTHTHLDRMPFAQGIYKTLRIPHNLMKKIMAKGSPLFINELFWSVGMALLNQCYSTRGLNTVAGFNIGSTMNNLCTVVLYANGAAIGIVVGRLLGAERYEEAYDTDRKMIVFSALVSFALSFVFLAISGLFPQLYNTSPEARQIATQVIMIQALFLPMAAIRNACYYTLRSGGRTIITFCFDSGFVWFINVPVAMILSRFTGVGATTIFFFIQLGDLFKAAIGLHLVHRKLWLRKFAR